MRMRPSVQRLSTDLQSVQQLVARSRPGSVRTHPDVQKLEADVQDLVNRWQNLSSQLSDRCVLLYCPIITWDCCPAERKKLELFLHAVLLSYSTEKVGPINKGL